MPQTLNPFSRQQAHGPDRRVARVLTVVFLTLTAVLGFDLVRSYQREFVIHEQAQSDAAEVIARQLRSSVDKIDVVLSEAVHAYTPLVQQGASSETVRAKVNLDLLRREAAIPESQVKSLRIIGADGQVLYSAGQGSDVPAVNVKDRAYFIQQRDRTQSGLVLSEPILSRFTGKWLFTLSRRIQLIDGSFGGLVQTAIRAEHFESAFRAVTHGVHDELALYSRVGPDLKLALAAHKPAREDELGKIQSLPELQAGLARSLAMGTFQVGSGQGVSARQYVYRSLADLPLVAVVSRSRVDILSDWTGKASVYGLSLLLLGVEVIWLLRTQRKFAIENSRLARQRLDRPLVDLGRSTLAAQGELQAALQEIAECAGQALACDVSISLDEGHLGEFRCVAEHHQSGHAALRHVPLSRIDRPEFFASLELNRVVSVADVRLHRDDAQWAVDRLAGWAQAALIDVPVRQGQRMIGLLTLEHHGRRAWSTDEENFAVSVGELVAHAVAAHEHWQSLQRLHLVDRVVMGAPVAVTICDATQRIVYVNEAFEAMTGRTALEVMGQPYPLQCDSHDCGSLDDAVWESLARDGVWVGEIVDCRKNGENYPQRLLLKRLLDEHGEVTHLIGMASDVSLEHAQRRQIEQLAYHDALTGLANRALFSDRLKGSMARCARSAGSRVAILLIDVDRFKGINDTHGHEVGDVLLQELGRRLKSCLREGDTLCRLGGDEFLVIVEDFESPDQLTRLGQRLHEAVSAPMSAAGTTFVVTVSIGVALYPDDGVSESDLIKNADIAMYQAKALGGGCLHFFTAELNDKVHKRTSLEQELRRALQSRDELFMMYQPKVSIATAELVGFEALVRWSPGPGRFIAPDQFIGIAEESQLIEPLGNWIIESVLAQMACWRDTPFARLPVAINVSPLQLKGKAFLRFLTDACERHGIARARVELEITEGVFIGDVDEARSKLDEIKDAGFRIALDDFGTGYSSFSYLASLPLDAVKIDRSFVWKIGHNEKSTAVLKAIIAITKELGLDLIAEGVETAEQAMWLQLAGADVAQGYHYSRPERAETLELKYATPVKSSAHLVTEGA